MNIFKALFAAIITAAALPVMAAEVKLSTGASCKYSAVAVAADGTMTVTCEGGGPVLPPIEPPVQTCPTVNTVGPVPGYEGLTNIRFNLRPNEVGSIGFKMPLFDIYNSAQLSIVGATYSETPLGTWALWAVSPCKGEFIKDVPDACRLIVARTGGTMNIGDISQCKLEAGKQYYLNLKFVDPSDWNRTSCPNPTWGYCSMYAKFNGR